MTVKGLEVVKRSDDRNHLRVMLEELQKKGDDPDDPLLADGLDERLVFGWDALTDYEHFVNPQFQNSILWEEPDDPMPARFTRTAKAPPRWHQMPDPPSDEAQPDAEEPADIPDDVSVITNSTALTVPRNYAGILRPIPVPDMSYDELERVAWGDDGSDDWDNATVRPRIVSPGVSPPRADGGDSKEEEVDPNVKPPHSDPGVSAEERSRSAARSHDPFAVDEEESEEIGGAAQHVRVVAPAAEPKSKSKEGGSVAFMLGIALMLATVAAVMN